MTIGLYEEIQTAVARMNNCSDEGIVADVQAAVDYLKTQPCVDPERIGIVGFCFGGRVSYLSACAVSGLKAASVFYGGRILQPLNSDGPSPLEQTANCNVPILGLFGEEDQNPSPEDVATIAAELQKHGKTHQFHMYPGCGHGFHCDGRTSYRPEAALDAWGKTLAWFDQYLKG
jgi:carboxymethylenebutenolidase